MKPFKTIGMTVSCYLSQPSDNFNTLNEVREEIEEKIKNKIADYCNDNNFGMSNFVICLETNND